MKSSEFITESMRHLEEKWIVLSGWDALDKAYTHEGKQRAREYAIKYLGIDRPAQDV